MVESKSQRGGNMSGTVVLAEHHTYELLYSIDRGAGPKKYRAVMTYLGKSKYGDLYFNLRPLAGTQTFWIDQIIEAKDLGATEGRDDSRHMRGVRVK
jgi:hypothetical protein